MRMHNRTMFRKYVRNADIGDIAVNEIWHGDTQIYPDNETLVMKLYVQVPDEGTLEWAYWVHSVRGVTASHELYKSSAQLMLAVGTESWWCGDNRPTGLYQCSVTEDGELAFATDQGPPVMDVGAGDYVTLDAVIPKTGDNRNTADSFDWTNPFLPDTTLWLEWAKGQKKQSARLAYKLTGISSGKTHIEGNAIATGHGRGTWYATGYPWPHTAGGSGMNQSGVNEYIEGDTGLHGEFGKYNSCSWQVTYPVYPAFEKTFTLKVRSVIVQSNS